MNEPGPVLSRLRASTASAHTALEDGLDAIARLSDLADRRALVRRYYRMHASADAAVAAWLGPIADLDMAARSRKSLLLRDLDALSLDVPDDLPVVTVASRAEALGVLYVLEGSSLGGRMIHKALIQRGADLAGLSFLDPYGPEAGARWRGFLTVLEREGANDIGAVVGGGVRGFEHAGACLLEPASV